MGTTRDYHRLIFLAEQLNVPSTREIVKELNVLLAATAAEEVKPEHASLIDSLISIMANTGNLLPQHQDTIVRLQDTLRGEI